MRSTLKYLLLLLAAFSLSFPIAGCKSGAESDEAAESESEGDPEDEGKAEETKAPEAADTKKKEGEATADEAKAADAAPAAAPTSSFDAKAVLGELGAFLPADTFAVATLDLALGTAGPMTMNPFGEHFGQKEIEALAADLQTLMKERLGFDVTGAKWALGAVGNGPWAVAIVGGDLGDFSGLESETIEGLEVKKAKAPGIFLHPLETPKATAVFFDKGNAKTFITAQKAAKLSGSAAAGRLNALLEEAGNGAIIVAVDFQAEAIADAMAKPIAELLELNPKRLDPLDEAITIFSGFAAEAQKHQGDCAAQGKALDAYVAEHKPRIQELGPELMDMKDSDREGEVERAFESAEEAVAQCDGNKDKLIGLVMAMVEGSNGPGGSPALDDKAKREVMAGLNGLSIRVDATAKITVTGSEEKLATIVQRLKALETMARAELEKAKGEVANMHLEEALMVTLADHMIGPGSRALMPKHSGETLTLEFPFLGGAELVAIIGVGAAVAIPAFVKYVRESKTSEAEWQLRSVGDGALVYYQSEHADPQDPLKVTTGVFPEAGQRACTSSGGSLDEKTIADEAQWDLEPWKSLRFAIYGPHYFQYCYQTSEDQKAFAATAEADDLVFCLRGTSGGGWPELTPVLMVDSVNDCKIN